MAKELELLSGVYSEMRHTPSGAAVSAGVLTLQGAAYGFPIADIPDGDEGVLVLKAENVRVAKEASLAIAAGDLVYFDTSAREADKTSTNKLIGTAIKPAALADTHVRINFDGTLAALRALAIADDPA